jgi:hydroxymethylpyrimidine/phosphomethylpyrimidine kinase
MIEMDTTERYPVVLTVAGSDSGGCAGIQADIKTISALGLFGASVITAVTAQNTTGVRAVEVLSPEIVKKQLEAVLDDITVDAVKTGMLPSPEIIEVVAGVIDRYRLPKVVVDPVMVATSGARLTSSSGNDALRELLYPRITLLTPNIPEAEALSGVEIGSEDDVRRAAEVLLARGCRAVLIKGGHFHSAEATDTLFRADAEPVSFASPRLASRNTHGTGCTFSSAIAAYLALGSPLEEAVGRAKEYISTAIDSGKNVRTGHGFGPVNHFFAPLSLIKFGADSQH